jgi:tmRNA-binding protein
VTNGRKLIAENRRARHEYHILERLEAGVELAKGKEGADKRHAVADRDAKRQTDRALKEQFRR